MSSCDKALIIQKHTDVAVLYADKLGRSLQKNAGRLAVPIHV